MYLFRAAVQCLGLTFLSLILPSNVLMISQALAQTSSATQPKRTPKPVVQKSSGTANKQIGLKPSAVNRVSNYNSMNLNPELFQKKGESELTGNTTGNLDFRVKRGCLRRSYSEDKLPNAIGIDDRAFADFFKSKTKRFFDGMRGDCIPYAVAFGSRNRFDSLSIMNGPVQDAKTEVWTFTPSAAGSFLIQQEYLKEEAKQLTEIQIPLRDVLYDPRKVGDKLPVELVWELNGVIKQIYPEDNNSHENTNSVVRIIVDFGDKERWAQIRAVEIIDPTTKEIFSSAFWVERDGIPGGFFTSTGEALERSFWTNPLSYRRISRGVGSVRVTSTSKRVSNKKGAAPSSAEAPSKQKYRAHMGIDYAAPIGTPVFSVATGKVVHMGFSGAFGNLIILEHPGSYHTYYAHLSKFNSELELGNEVRRGFEIGYVGLTGRSTGPHLHFELRKDGVYVDPYAARMQLNLWSMRDDESGLLTSEILLLGSLAPN
ncbi:M23 family metallopeptidase [Polynucleobacter meluiroseus]|nr:M23 family metallopeptidase [Polynucleobacter meluiroseus]